MILKQDCLRAQEFKHWQIKGKWEAQSLSKLKETTEKALTKNDKTKLQIQHNADIQNQKFHKPKLTAYDANAPKQPPVQQPQVKNSREIKIKIYPDNLGHENTH